jgi:serine O-acetyltransferase
MMYSIIINSSLGFYRFREICIKANNNPIIKYITRLLYRLYEKQHCAYIPLEVSFHSEPNLPHGLNGIHISGSSKIGSNVTIYQNVTIGSIGFADSNIKGAPIVLKNVVIGAGTVIVGKVIVGDNSRIAPNSLVTKDVPANSIFINNKIIQRANTLDNRVFSYRKGNLGFLKDGKFIINPK